MDTNAELRQLKEKHGLKGRDIAQLLGKPLNSSNGYSNRTVDHWLDGSRACPAMAIELLRLKLGDGG